MTLLFDIDIAGAQANGIHTIWFNHWGGTCDPDDARPDTTIHESADLLAVLDRLDPHPRRSGSVQDA
jgi:FMN phosphatase YigB (HAD superfamily)